MIVVAFVLLVFGTAAAAVPLEGQFCAASYVRASSPEGATSFCRAASVIEGAAAAKTMK